MGRDKHDIFDVRLDPIGTVPWIYTPYTMGWATSLYNGGFQPLYREYVDINLLRYWQRSLFERAKSTFTIKFGDEDIYDKNAIDILYYELFLCGFVCFFNPKEKTDLGNVTLFQPCFLNDFDVFYRPLYATLAHPKLKEEYSEMKIGEECEILKLTPDYMGVWDTIAYYAEQLAMMQGSINMSVLNARYSKIIGAKDLATAETLQEIMSQSYSGKPFVTFSEAISDNIMSSGGENSASPFQVYDAPSLKTSYITDMQLQDFQSILNMFDAEVGIATAPFEKKERMVVDEANSKQQDATSRHKIWIKTLKDTADKVNDMFDLDISIEDECPDDATMKRSEAPVVGMSGGQEYSDRHGVM